MWETDCGIVEVRSIWPEIPHHERVEGVERFFPLLILDHLHDVGLDADHVVALSLVDQGETQEVVAVSRHLVDRVHHAVADGDTGERDEQRVRQVVRRVRQRGVLLVVVVLASVVQQIRVLRGVLLVLLVRRVDGVRERRNVPERSARKGKKTNN